MFKRFNANFITALCTGCALVAFALLQAYVNVSATALYLAAAAICIFPVVFAAARRKQCRDKSSNAR